MWKGFLLIFTYVTHVTYAFKLLSDRAEKVRTALALAKMDLWSER